MIEMASYASLARCLEEELQQKISAQSFNSSSTQSMSSSNESLCLNEIFVGNSSRNNHQILPAYYSARVDDDGNEIVVRTPRNQKSAILNLQQYKFPFNLRLAALESKSSTSSIEAYEERAADDISMDEQSAYDAYQQRLPKMKESSTYTRISSNCSSLKSMQPKSIAQEWNNFEMACRQGKQTEMHAAVAADAAFIKVPARNQTFRISHEDAQQLAIMDMSAAGDGKSWQGSENNSNLVPPLDLDSIKNSLSTESSTFCRKNYMAARLNGQDTEAYSNWLSAKKKDISRAADKRKEIEMQKLEKEQERKRIAKETYEKWLNEKIKQQQLKQIEKQNEKLYATFSNYSLIASKSKTKLTPQEAKAKRDEWERKKLLQNELKREKLRQELKLRQQREQERRLMSDRAFDQWKATAIGKPKPVPLNQGLLSLRGTTSKMYINPNEWQSIVPAQDH